MREDPNDRIVLALLRAARQEARHAAKWTWRTDWGSLSPM